MKTEKRKPPARRNKALRNDGAKRTTSLSEMLDRFFEQKMNGLAWVVLALGILFSLLLFDTKVSLSGDDSAYIMRAHAFAHNFEYPGFQGPLYPLVLSLFVAVFGLNITALKLFSFFCLIGFLFLFIRYYRNRISGTLLFFTALLVSINSFLLYYASQTYSEAFYMLILMLLTGLFFARFIDNQEEKTKKKLFFDHLLLAFCLLVLTLTRSIGLSAVIAVAAYFLLTARWRDLLYSVTLFFVLFALFQVGRHLIWGDEGLYFAAQGSSLLNKDYYNAHYGKEDLTGLMKRLYENSNLYLSKHFLGMTGLRSFASQADVVPTLTLLLAVIFSITLIVSYGKNKYLFFTALLSASFLLISFLALQTSWDQNRLIIPVFPFMIMMLLASFNYVGNLSGKLKYLRFALPVLILVMLSKSFETTVAYSRDNLQSGGRFRGLTPDWVNYILASEWAAENLEENDLPACRKPSISFIYGNGRNFYGIFRMPEFSNETFFKIWEKNHGNMILVDYDLMENNQIAPTVMEQFLMGSLAVVIGGENYFMAIQLPEAEMSEIFEIFDAQNYEYFFSEKEFRENVLANNNPMGVFYPDSMLMELRNNGITHIITANLRHDPDIKDVEVISTVERYASMIESKYPGIFRKIKQFGADHNEPAAIYWIDYGLYE